MNYSINYMMNTSFSLLNMTTYSMKMISLYLENTSIGFGSKNETINICIIPNDQIHQLHYGHLLVLAQHVHLTTQTMSVLKNCSCKYFVFK